MIMTILILILISIFSFSSEVIFDEDFSSTVIYFDPIVKSSNSCIENLSTEQLEEMYEEYSSLLQYYLLINSCYGTCRGQICCEIVIIVEAEQMKFNFKHK